MANNRVEARERAEKATMSFGFSFIIPLLFLPVLNRQFLKTYKVAKTFDKNEVKIMNLSKKYLAKDAQYMLEGLNKLKEELKPSNKHEGIENILNRFKGREEELRQKLIKVHDKIMLSDIIITGGLMGSIYWIVNAITKKKTGRDGFSAEYKMASEEYVEGKAENYKKEYKNNVLKGAGILLASSLGFSLLFKKSMLSKQQNIIKKYAQLFDYTDGIYMSRSILALVALFGDVPNTLLASRDKEELKYNVIKNIVGYGVFLGGDLVLNNIVARTLDNMYKDVNLVNFENLDKDAPWWKKITAPLYSLKEISQKTNWAPEVLKKTKNFKIAMFWANFAAVTAFMGFGTPYFLNKMVKNKVKEETEQK